MYTGGAGGESHSSPRLSVVHQVPSPVDKRFEQRQHHNRINTVSRAPRSSAGGRARRGFTGARGRWGCAPQRPPAAPEPCGSPGLRGRRLPPHAGLGGGLAGRAVTPSAAPARGPARAEGSSPGQGGRRRSCGHRLGASSEALEAGAGVWGPAPASPLAPSEPLGRDRRELALPPGAAAAGRPRCAPGGAVRR